MQHFLQDMNSGLDHSVIENKTRGGIVILKSAPLQHEGKCPTNLEHFIIWQERKEYFAISTVLVLDFV